MLGVAVLSTARPMRSSERIATAVIDVAIGLEPLTMVRFFRPRHGGSGATRPAVSRARSIGVNFLIQRNVTRDAQIEIVPLIVPRMPKRRHLHLRYDRSIHRNDGPMMLRELICYRRWKASLALHPLPIDAA